MTLGAGVAHNEIIDQRPQGLDYPVAGFLDLGMRVGLTNQLDMGAGFFGLGGRLDAKYNLLDSRERLAISPRLGAGYGAVVATSALTAFAGGLVSYEVFPWLTPYGGASFANYWISHEPSETPRLEKNERLADRAGHGDGLVQLQGGLAFQVGRGSQLFIEYGRFLPAQNDLGDKFSFVATDLLVIGWQIPLFGWKNDPL